MNAKTILFAAVATLSLAAQDATRKITAAVPFAFEMNGARMSAGKYDVIRTENSASVTVRNAATGKTVVFVSGGAKTNKLDTNAIVFHRYDDRYFLAAIAVRSAGLVFNAPRSRTEKEMAKAKAPETVAAAAE